MAAPPRHRPFHRHPGAVTARTHRSKAEQDPAQWMPSTAEAHYRYIAERVATKSRWDLAAGESEGARCGSGGRLPGQQVTWELAV
ncbi:hypothetical protein [Streptomyces sp. NPDC048187]|uniref:hypothetical protein n=1 Tax=Streptomyces sp. NPDC048187 TaxID=3365509 RepID=UPI0037165F53